MPPLGLKFSGAGCFGVLPEAALEIGRMQHQLKFCDCSDGTLAASNLAISTWSGLLKRKAPRVSPGQGRAFFSVGVSWQGHR
eukprot:4392212-Pyramimonas_sp.AAC.1